MGQNVINFLRVIICLLCCTTTVYAASSKESSVNEEHIVDSIEEQSTEEWQEDPFCTILTEKDFSDKAVEQLEQIGIRISDEMVISFPVKTNSLGEERHVIRVQRENDDSFLVNTEEWVYLFSQDKNGLFDIDDEWILSLLAEVSPQVVEVDYPCNKPAFSIHGYTYKNKYNTIFNPYYRPFGVAFSYTTTAGNVISYIQMQYKSDGALFTWPGLLLVDDTYEYNIFHSRNNPVQGSTYTSTSNSFPAGKVMQYGGSPFAGEFVYFTVTVNGVTNVY